jgi:hypothetical protein
MNRLERLKSLLNSDTEISKNNIMTENFNYTDVELINLTPHPVNIEGYGEIPPSGKIARASEQRKKIGEINGISVNVVTLGNVVDLPSSKPNTFYIVSRVVAEAERGKRDDLLIPDEAIRDSSGKIIGAKSLAVIK